MLFLFFIFFPFYILQLPLIPKPLRNCVFIHFHLEYLELFDALICFKISHVFSADLFTIRYKELISCNLT
jgi:hypothetical protein